ncbi:MAG: YggT family protein [Syntrophomonadaceae bacterium]|nr:YggT family protein [Syntrophomonadaceae bacterium]
MLIYDIVDIIFDVMMFLIVVRVILSFIRIDPYQPLIRYVYEITEPVLAPFRRLLPFAGGLDFSPILAWMALMLVRNIVLGIISALI